MNASHSLTILAIARSSCRMLWHTFSTTNLISARVSPTRAAHDFVWNEHVTNKGGQAPLDVSLMGPELLATQPSVQASRNVGLVTQASFNTRTLSMENTPRVLPSPHSFKRSQYALSAALVPCLSTLSTAASKAGLQAIPHHAPGEVEIHINLSSSVQEAGTKTSAEGTASVLGMRGLPDSTMELMSSPSKQTQSGAGAVRKRKRPQCAEYSCTIRPYFNVEGASNGLFCATHRKPGMLNVLNRTCQDPSCKKVPVFNLEGLKQGLFCADHRQEGMVNVLLPQCEHSNCKKTASYNVKGCRVALFCSAHKREGMEDIRSRSCEKDGCKTRPSFNMAGQKKPRFCAVHALPDMVDVRHKRCEGAGCKKFASFSIPGASTARFCVQHKESGMISQRARAALARRSKMHFSS